MVHTRRTPRAARVATLAAAALLVLPLAACGGDDGGSDGTVTLDFVWWGNEDRAKVTEAAIDLFEQKHPNIKVNTSFGAFDAYFQKLSTQIAGGDAPDVIQMDRAYLREYADRNALRDLTEYIEDGTLRVGDITPTLLPAGKVGDATYAIPVAQNTQGVVYDPALWSKAGVPAPSPNWTWDDMLAAGQKLNQASGGKVAGFGDFGFAIDWFDIWLRQRDKAIYTDDGKLGFTEAELTEFWTMTGRMREAGALAPPALTTQLDGSVQNSSLIKKGVTAEVNYDSSFTAMVSAYGAPLAIAPMPSDTPKRGMIASMSMAYSVAQRSEHPKEAAMLIDFLINDVEAGKVLAVSRGMPANAKVRDAIAPSLSETDKQVYEFENSVASLLLPTPPAQPKGGGAVKAEFQRIYDEVIFGRISVAEGAKRVLEEARNQLG
ncbi:ABC transporter substrate-binding protein [Micromonospora sp. HM5-17]|jgi:multiple sugar transport system substrate-binding protein|uniref:ABC transporter substrate-binding protein n=1 Tax=Micromonospora sp. HM5-17 TaxID=2487710 RepID=UPI000F45F107|nr:sugar ABC transporter substrate-binding protein [Micromonospora sp. HM5-17]ROT32959.1 sugar ABC transporter substrate-binding protein [Micromonospora sp. HM5-17]